MLAVFTGNGKGKTTASLGQAVRLVGRGKRVLMIQFIKGPWKSGEDFAEIRKKRQATSDPSSPMLRRADKRQGTRESGFFELRKRGLGFVGILGDKLPIEDHRKAAEAALEEFAAELKNGSWDAIILDEVNVAVNLELLTAEQVLAHLASLGEEILVILTGRGAPQELIDRADLVTEMREVKHPFRSGKLGKLFSEF